jgi:hypothetical protein
MLFLLILITVLGSTAAWGQAQSGPDPAIVYKKGSLILSQSFRRVRLQVEVADTPMARAQGLMYRRHLPENAGMLFIFADTVMGGFWMKNTLIPLSIAFVDEKWKIVDIKDMKVEQDPTKPINVYAPAQPYRYALEVNLGFFERHRIAIGAGVRYIPQNP